jgi:hypothetical protein
MTKSTESNAGVVRNVARSIAESDDLFHDCNCETVVCEPHVQPRIAKAIESALTAAQSQLAEKVLEAVVEYKGTFALVRGVEGDIIDVTCNQIDQRMRDLFSRLGIEVGGE